MSEFLIIAIMFFMWIVAADITHAKQMKRIAIAHERSNWLRDIELSITKAQFDWQKMRSLDHRISEDIPSIRGVKGAGVATWFDKKDEKTDAPRTASLAAEAKQNMDMGDL